MKQAPLHTVLIQKIEQLYFRITLIILHKRINGYHKVATHKKHASDIKTPLHDCIDIIVGYAMDNPEVIYTIDHIKNDSSNLHRPGEKHTASQHATVNPQHLGEISKYFKARGLGSDLHPGIQEKLELSTWDHVHATMRCARAGNERCSKMHAEITDCACKELAHYMNMEDYQAFITEVKQHLSNLKADHQNNHL